MEIDYAFSFIISVLRDINDQKYLIDSSYPTEGTLPKEYFVSKYRTLNEIKTCIENDSFEDSRELIEKELIYNRLNKENRKLEELINEKEQELAYLVKKYHKDDLE